MTNLLSTIRAATLAVCLVTLTLLSPSTPQSAMDAGVNLAVRDVYGKLPMGFAVNRGQADSAVKFVAQGTSYHLALTTTEAVLEFRKAGKAPRRKSGCGIGHRA